LMSPSPIDVYALALHDALPILIVTGFGEPAQGEGDDISGHAKADDDGCQYQRLWNGVGIVRGLGANNGWGVDYQTAADKQKQVRSEEHTSELQSRENLVCRLLL